MFKIINLIHDNIHNIMVQMMGHTKFLSLSFSYTFKCHFRINSRGALKLFMMILKQKAYN